MLLQDAVQYHEEYRKKHSPSAGEWDTCYKVSHVILNKPDYFSYTLSAYCLNMEDFTKSKFYWVSMKNKGDKRYVIREMSPNEVSVADVFTRLDWNPQLPKEAYLQ